MSVTVLSPFLQRCPDSGGDLSVLVISRAGYVVVEWNVASSSTSSCHKWIGSVSPSTTISSVEIVAVVGGDESSVLPEVSTSGAGLSWSIFGIGCVVVYVYVLGHCALGW